MHTPISVSTCMSLYTYGSNGAEPNIRNALQALRSYVWPQHNNNNDNFIIIIIIILDGLKRTCRVPVWPDLSVNIDLFKTNTHRHMTLQTVSCKLSLVVGFNVEIRIRNMLQALTSGSMG